MCFCLHCYLHTPLSTSPFPCLPLPCCTYSHTPHTHHTHTPHTHATHTHTTHTHTTHTPHTRHTHTHTHTHTHPTHTHHTHTHTHIPHTQTHTHHTCTQHTHTPHMHTTHTHTHTHSYENCRPPPPMDNPVLPPPFVVRAILLFGRSHSMPVYRGDVTVRQLEGTGNVLVNYMYSTRRATADKSHQHWFGCRSWLDVMHSDFDWYNLLDVLTPTHLSGQSRSGWSS